MIEAVLADANVTLDTCDAVAATAGPGLIGGVMVGLVSAKALAMAGGKPLIAITPPQRPALSPRRAAPAPNHPHPLLQVSGRHCHIPSVAGTAIYHRLPLTNNEA